MWKHANNGKGKSIPWTSLGTVDIHSPKVYYKNLLLKTLSTLLKPTIIKLLRLPSITFITFFNYIEFKYIIISTRDLLNY